jgi:four helix bundle protein
MRIEDLHVYQRLCDLHLEVCDLTQKWPSEEKYELASQVRRSSNSAPAQLAEKHSDRHGRNKIEGVNRARGAALETVHHLFMASRKKYIHFATMKRIGNDTRNWERYQECVRMLNGLERKPEMQLDPSVRRFPQRSETEP